MTEKELIKLLASQSERLPYHIAVIMDGNGRWAKRRFLPRIMGHRSGVKSVRTVVQTAAKLHIPYLTLYAFSTENWARPKDEVNALMKLLNEYLKKEVKELKKNNIRLKAIGRISELPTNCQKALNEAIEYTKNSTGTTLVLALNYGGRAEIIDSFNKIISENPKIKKINEELLKENFYFPELPDVDLLIRTSGEERISNFLLWQCAYSEIYITTRLWPEFRAIDFLHAIHNYLKRERRFGGVK
jgi:undecaprenyl diphosphate synthase